MVTIYALTCTLNGKAYVGSTKGKLGKRMREHRCLLEHDQHGTPELQTDWRAHGGHSFAISAVEELPTADLPARREAELRWMDAFAEKGLLYNERRISMRPAEAARLKGIENSRGVVGNRWTPEANEKRRQAQLGVPKGHGAKISATKRAQRLAVMR